MSRLQGRHAVPQGITEPDQGADDAREFRYGWIDADAAIRHLGLGSRTALYRLIEEHQLPYGRVGRRYRFRRCDLDQWAGRRGAVLTALRRA